MTSFLEIGVQETLEKGIIVVVAVTGIIIFQKMLRKVIKKAKFSEHIKGILTLISTLTAATLGLFLTFKVLGFPVEWLALTGTLTATAIGFASTQTIGNFLAGLYILLTMPFKVLDYIKIEKIEGEVRAITINYTRIFTPTYNLMEIPNREVLNSRIENCAEGDLIDYTFTLGFNHKMGNKELICKCINPAIEEFYTIHEDELPRKPECSLTKIERLGRTFAIRFFFTRGKAEMFYDLRPELKSMIIERWDNITNPRQPLKILS